MRVIPYDIQTNITMSHKVLGTIKSNSKTFLPRVIDDLKVIGEERYTDELNGMRGQLVFHFDSDKSRFHVDVCSAMVPVKLYNSKPMEDNLIEFVSMYEFHRTMFARKGFKNGRLTLSYEPKNR